jgi:hypothetical protein
MTNNVNVNSKQNVSTMNYLAKKQFHFWVALSLLMLFLNILINWKLVFVHPIEFPDSAGYYISPETTNERYSLVKFYSGAGRGWGVTLLYGLLGSKPVIVLFQLVLQTLAFLFLVKSLLLFSQSRKLTTIYSFIVLGIHFFLIYSQEVQFWNFSIMSHSLAISYNIFIFTFFLKTHNSMDIKTQITNFLFMNIFILLSSVSRTINYLFFILSIAILIEIYIKNKKSNIRGRKIIFASLSVFVLILSGYSFSYNQKMSFNTHSIDMYSLNASFEQFNIGNPISKSFISYLKRTDAPECLFNGIPIQTTSEMQNYWGHLAGDCETGSKWMGKNYTKHLTTYLIQNPIGLLKSIQHGINESLLKKNTVYNNSVVTLIPLSIESLFFQPLGFNLFSMPFIFYLLIIFSIQFWIFPFKKSYDFSGHVVRKVSLISIFLIYLISIVFLAYGSDRTTVDLRILIYLFMLQVTVLDVKLLFENLKSEYISQKNLGSITTP